MCNLFTALEVSLDNRRGTCGTLFPLHYLVISTRLHSYMYIYFKRLFYTHIPCSSLFILCCRTSKLSTALYSIYFTCEVTTPYFLFCTQLLWLYYMKISGYKLSLHIKEYLPYLHFCLGYLTWDGIFQLNPFICYFMISFFQFCYISFCKYDAFFSITYLLMYSSAVSIFQPL